MKRIADGAASQTAVGDLAYAASVLAHGTREGLVQDASGPAEARAQIAAEGLRINSQKRERRISDAEFEALVAACDAVTSSLPLRDLVCFALATAMRRGEILRLRWSDVNEADRTIIVRNRKHPRDHDRVDEAPLMRVHPEWPRWDAREIIKRQPRAERAELIFRCVNTDNAMVALFDRSTEGEIIEEVVRWMRQQIDIPPEPEPLKGQVTVDAYVRHQRQKIDRGVALLDAELRARLENYVMHRVLRDVQ